MKNLNIPNLDCMAIFTEAVGRKIDQVAAARIMAELPTISASFQQYEVLYGTHTLENLAPTVALAKIGVDLEGMYSFQSKAVQDILRKIKEVQPQTTREVCQYCSLAKISSMDHIVFKKRYPEFALHARNLAPSCADCNTLKGERWMNGGHRLFLNLYLDDLPEEDYLFVEVLDDGREIDFEFRVECPITIEQDRVNLIKSHYTKLNLSERMRAAAITLITEILGQTNRDLTKGTSLAEIAGELIENAAELREYYGRNYWKAVLQEALANSDVFWEKAPTFR